MLQKTYSNHFGGKGNDRYSNEASMMWGALKDVINVISLPDDRFMQAEVSSRRFKMPKNKIKIESKEVFKKEYGSSPDRGDVLVMLFFDKEDERVVLNNFDRFDKSIVLDKSAYRGSTESYTSIYYSSDLFVSIIRATWDGYRLHIESDFSGDNNVHLINQHLHHINVSGNTVIGNDRMFGKGGQDLAAQFGKQGIMVTRNFGYDESGAVQLFMLLLQEKRLTMSSGCISLADQMESWNMMERQSVIESKYGLCYAVVNLASKLRDVISTPWSPKPVVEYNKSTPTVSKTGLIDNPMLLW